VSDAEPPVKADREPWARARTLRELGELMALWLEGKIRYQPGYLAADADDETSELVPVLARINRAGLMTDFSQPGEKLDESGWQQRAALGGYCSEELKDRIKAKLLDSDLVVLTYAPGAVFDYVDLCITAQGDRENTWIGGRLDDKNIDHHYTEDVHPEGVAALHDAWQISVVDAVWGRNDYLWPRLVAAVNG
jgi:hypothetical protein